MVLGICIHIWRVRKDGFAVTRSAVTVTDPEDAAGVGRGPATAPAELYGGRTRVLGIVDRETVTAEERATDDTVFTWPHLIVRHVVVALCTAVVVLIIGVAFAAPLRDIANPNLTPEPAKAPWYFVGLQELLNHFDPLVAGILVPAGVLLVLTFLPYVDRNPATEARNRKLAVCIFIIILTVAFVLTIIGLAFRGPGWKFVPPWDHNYIEM
jgi:quinol-cytochrome oxidoreductase complex cytochrome b subunit